MDSLRRIVFMGMKSSNASLGRVVFIFGFLLGLMRFSIAADAGLAPRPGKYNVLSYGAVGRPPLYLGHIELQAGGKYRISRTSKADYFGEGTYSFDAATSTVTWLSGPCKDDGWSGTFTIEREGKTHKIRLRPTTIATNSTDG